MDSSARWARFTRLLRSAVRDLFDQTQPFGRLALVHSVFSVGTTLVTISLAGTLFFTIQPEAAKGKVLLYLLLTITPFAVVAPALSPLLDRGKYARRTSVAISSVGSAVLVFLMAGDIKGLLLFPEAFGVLVLSKLYLVAKAALVPSMTETEDDLASANAKLAVLASLAGFVASPVAVGLLQLGAPWVLRLACVVFLLGGVAAMRLPKTVGAVVAKPAAATADGRPILGPPVPGKSRWPQAAGRPLYERPPPSDKERQVRIDVARERQRLGLPLYVPEVVLALAAMSVIRGAVGFLTFFLAFALKHLHAATWWYGFVLLTSAVGSLLGSLLVPTFRRFLSEQQLILYSLVLSALVGILVAISGSLWVQPLLTLAIGFATTAAKPSFDSIAQRHVPPALLGRAFARFETQLQLVWVLCGLLAVVVGFPLSDGDLLIGVTCAVAAGFHVSMRRAVLQTRLTERRARRADLPGTTLN
ncbi:MAG TPA: MFS transporter [Acidimicrobiales bacterium]|nr:MFS transporter [Acidimicrobiales bacterium]